MQRNWPLCFILLLLISASIQAFAGDDRWLNSLSYLKDQDRQLTVDDVIGGAPNAKEWISVSQPMVNFGFSDAAYWVRFNVESPNPQATEYMLHIANPKISHLDVYLLSEKSGVSAIEKHWESGIGIPVAQRVFPHRHFVFPITLPQEGRWQVLMRVESSYPVKLPLHWSTPVEFHQRDQLDAIFQGVYFGSILIMAFYNLFIYVVVRDRSYALYFVFMWVMTLFMAVDRGIAYEFLWPGQAHTDYVAYVALMSFAAGWSVFFSVEFLSLRNYMPGFARGFTALGIFWMVMSVLALWWASPALVIFEVLIVVPAGVALIIAGLLAWKKGVPAAPYYTIAWFVIIHGALVYALTLVNLFPPGAYAEYALQVCSIAEAALLSLGLAHRIKTLDRERNVAYAAARAKTELLATMSHEIRTPMNGMLGMAQLLKDTGITEQQQRYVNTILSSGQALLTLLNDTLDLSKIEAKKLELECLEFDLRQLIDESAAIFSLRAVEKRLRFFVGVDVAVGRRVLGDPTRVRQVLANLLSNAFKFTDSGTVGLRVGVEQTSGRLMFEVQDSGIGMKAETVSKLFSPFVQASASTSRQYGGTGLGLSICKHLVEMMGGTIGVRSTEGSGSSFWFSLPLETLPLETLPGKSGKSLVMDEVKSLRVVSQDQELVAMLKAYALHWGIAFAAFNDVSALSAGESAPEGMVLFDTLGAPQWLGALERLGLTGTALLQCQWGVIVKPGESVTRIPGFRHTAWVYEIPFSISLMERHIHGHFLSASAVNMEASPEKSLPPLTGKCVLVVDDNPINSLVVCGFLGKMGIETQVAHNGLEALDMLEQTPDGFDLVLMDCEMPGMNGYEATQTIRRREQAEGRARRKVVALSAHAMADHLQKCRDAGMDDMLTKPILFAALQSKLRTLLS